MDFLSLPVDLRIKILVELPLNDVWNLYHCHDKSILLTFYCCSRRYFISRLNKIINRTKHASVPDKLITENLFDSYISTLIDNNLAHLEPDLFDLNSPILTPSIGHLIGIRELGLRAVKYSNRDICSYILLIGASTVEIYPAIKKPF